MIRLTNEQAAEWATKLNAAAVKWAVRERAGNAFARGKQEVCISIMRQVSRNLGFVSERQMAYAEKLVAWLNYRPARQTPDNAAASQARSEEQLEEEMESQSHRDIQYRPTSVGIDPAAISRIGQLFEAARANGLLRPRITVSVEGTPITFKLFRGNIGVLGRNDRWLGMILGSPLGFEPHGSAITPQELRAIMAFGRDPLGVATAHGRNTGRCCFCRKTLTDARSVAMGYGPTCAERYGLQWGTQRAAIEVTVNLADLPPTAELIRPVSIPPLRSSWQQRLTRRRAVERPVFTRGGNRPSPSDAAEVQPLDYDDEDSQFM